MIGAGCAQFRQARGVSAIDETQDVIVVLHGGDEAALARDQAAQLRQNISQERLTVGLRQPLDPCAAEARRAFVALSEIARRFLDQRQRQFITCLAIIGPVDQAVPAEHDADGARIGGDRLAQNQAEIEARPLPIDPHNLVPVDLPRELLAVAGGGDGDDGVRMTVVDVSIRDEGVQGRIDGAGARIQIEDAVRVHRDHVIFDRRLHARDIGRMIDIAQAQELVHVERGEVLSLGRAQVAAGAFDKQDFDIGAGQGIALRDLAGGVAAAGIGDALVAAQQVGAVHELVDGVERRGDVVLPQVTDVAIIRSIKWLHESIPYMQNL